MIRRPPRSPLFPYTPLSRSLSVLFLQPANRLLLRHLFHPPFALPLPRSNVGHRCVPTAKNIDRKSTRLNSSHSQISYAVFCLKKKTRRNRAARAAPSSVAPT